MTEPQFWIVLETGVKLDNHNYKSMFAGSLTSEFFERVQIAQNIEDRFFLLLLLVNIIIIICRMTSIHTLLVRT